MSPEAKKHPSRRDPSLYAIRINTQINSLGRKLTNDEPLTPRQKERRIRELDILLKIVDQSYRYRESYEQLRRGLQSLLPKDPSDILF